MTDEIQRYEMTLLHPDGSGQLGNFEREKSAPPADLGDVLRSIGGLIGASHLQLLEFPNPENPLHWHVLFWDAEGLVKGLPLNTPITTHMQDVAEDFPSIYGVACMVRDKFWTDDEVRH